MLDGQGLLIILLCFPFSSTFDEIECWLYGGKSVNRFRKIIRKSAWFTVIAAQLNKCGTTGDFNAEMQAMFSRAGDYIRVGISIPQYAYMCASDGDPRSMFGCGWNCLRWYPTPDTRHGGPATLDTTSSMRLIFSSTILR